MTEKSEEQIREEAQFVDDPYYQDEGYKEGYVYLGDGAYRPLEPNWDGEYKIYYTDEGWLKNIADNCQHGDAEKVREGINERNPIVSGQLKQRHEEHQACTAGEQRGAGARSERERQNDGKEASLQDVEENGPGATPATAVNQNAGIGYA